MVPVCTSILRRSVSMCQAYCQRQKRRMVVIARAISALVTIVRICQASLSFCGRGCLSSNGASGTVVGKLETVLIAPNSLPVDQPWAEIISRLALRFSMPAHVAPARLVYVLCPHAAARALHRRVRFSRTLRKGVTAGACSLREGADGRRVCTSPRRDFATTSARAWQEPLLSLGPRRGLVPTGK